MPTLKISTEKGSQEVDALALFSMTIGEVEFHFVVHQSLSDFNLVVSEFESGCKVATLDHDSSGDVIYAAQLAMRALLDGEGAARFCTARDEFINKHGRMNTLNQVNGLTIPPLSDSSMSPESITLH